MRLTTDTVELIRRRYVDDDSEMLALLDEERTNAKIAQAIFDLRKQLGLSQREFASQVGIKASAICRLENADYDGHSVRMLQRIAEAFDYSLQLEIRFIPKEEMAS